MRDVEIVEEIADENAEIADHDQMPCEENIYIIHKFLKRFNDEKK